MSAEGGHMTDVELVPEGVDVEAPARAGGRAPGGRSRAHGPLGGHGRHSRHSRHSMHGRRYGRLRPRRRALVAGGLVAAVAAAVLVEGRAEHADLLLANAVAPAGAVASLREPVEEQWRAPGRVVGGADDVLLLAEVDGDATVLRGRDAATGGVLWSQALPPVRVRCPRTLERLDPDGAVAGATDVLVLCEVHPWSARSLGDGQLWVLDPGDGSVRARRTLAFRTSWDVLGGDLVLARQAGRELRVSRESLTDTGVRWSVSLRLPDGVSAAQLDVRAGDGLVAVGGAMGAVLTADGDLLGRWYQGSRPAVAVRTDADGFAVWTDSGEGRWFDRSGRPGVRLPGEPIDVVDGAPGSSRNQFLGDARTGMPDDLLLVRTPGGIAVADVTGRGLLWSRGGARMREVVVVGGAAVLATRSRVWVIDLVEGRPLWSAERGVGADAGALLTDGLRVLVPGHDGSARSVSARSLADGDVLWTVRLPRDAVAVEAGPDGVLLAPVRDGVVVLGP